MDGGQVISRIRTVVAGTKTLLALSVAMIAVAFLAVTSSGRADDVPPATRFAVGSAAMQIAQGIAQANWGMDACNGQVVVEWGSDDANINARSDWANPVSAYGAPAQNLQCRVVFNATMSFSWPKFCTVLVHEYGHLTGHPHTVDGGDVMSPIYRAPLPACMTDDPSAAPPAPAAAPVTVPTTATPASIAVDAPTRRAAKRARARAAGAKRSRAKAKAHAATRPLKRFSDADVEAPPWAPFAPAL